MSPASLRAVNARNNKRLRQVEKCAAMRRRKAELRIALAEERAPAWAPPAVRRIVAIIDLDSGRPMIRTLTLLRGDRADNYRVRTARGSSRRCYGWSAVMAVLRERLPSPRARPH